MCSFQLIVIQKNEQMDEDLDLDYPSKRPYQVYLQLITSRSNRATRPRNLLSKRPITNPPVLLITSPNCWVTSCYQCVFLEFLSILQGWTMLEEVCPKCNVPLMRDLSNQKHCLQCNSILNSTPDNVYMIIPIRNTIETAVSIEEHRFFPGYVSLPPPSQNHSIEDSDSFIQSIQQEINKTMILLLNEQDITKKTQYMQYIQLCLQNIQLYKQIY